MSYDMDLKLEESKQRETSDGGIKPAPEQSANQGSTLSTELPLGSYKLKFYSGHPPLTVTFRTGWIFIFLAITREGIELS